jgi:hypothetical protein
MKNQRVCAFSTLLLSTGAAMAQPTSSPGGGFTWALVAGAFVAGVAVGYYLGKNSGSGDSGSGDSGSGDDKNK